MFTFFEHDVSDIFENGISLSQETCLVGAWTSGAAAPSPSPLSPWQ
jgi:hypothetical protein